MKKMLVAIVLALTVGAYAWKNVDKNDSTSGDIDDQVKPKTTNTNSVAPSPSAVNNNQNAGSIQSAFKDGTYAGPSTFTFYGNVKVSAVISGGKLTDVKVLEYPNDRENSTRISNYSLPLLVSEAIKAQSGSVDVVSGATQTSEGFSKSLTSALAQAKS